MITPQEALSLLFKCIRPLPVERLPLDHAVGCSLAEDIRADRDLPPADRSAMDGYAVRCSGLRRLRPRLRIVGEVAAGSPARPRISPRTCARILTGANVPPGADAVVMVEQTREASSWVEILSPVARGENILRRAEDARKGTLLLPVGARLGSLRIGVCAAAGKAAVKVHRRPRVAVLCTGAELREAGGRIGLHESRNTNGPSICAALAECGWGGVRYGSVTDGLPVLTCKLRRLLSRCDLTLLTGGVSAGKYDFVREAVETTGGRVRFHGVAMKPGKPILYATWPGNRHLFGLPGNPLSAMVGFNEFALPALRRLSGFAAKDCRPAWRLPLASGLASKGGRVRYVLGRLRWPAAGPSIEPIPSRSSADLVSGGRADGVIIVPAEVRQFDAGALVEFHPWRPLP